MEGEGRAEGREGEGRGEEGRGEEGGEGMITTRMSSLSTEDYNLLEGEVKY